MSRAVRRTVSLLLTTLVLVVAPVVRADADRSAPAQVRPAAVVAAAAVNYGSGLWGGPVGSTVAVGNPASADVTLYGDSIAAGCHPAISKALAAAGFTLAVRARSGQNTAGLAALMEAQAAQSPVTVMIAGSNDMFSPPAMGAAVARVQNYLTEQASTLLWTDTYVARAKQTAAVQLHDARNSGWVNGQIHSRVPPEHVIGWDAALGAAVGRGRSLSYYLRDGVHPWPAAGTGHGDGCAFLAAVIVPKVKAARS